MPTDPAQLFINTSNDPGLIVGPRVDASGALRYPTDEPQSSNTIVNIIQYNLNTIGANNQVLINKDNVATGDAELTYDADTNILTTETLNVGNLTTAFSANLGNIANVKITGGSNGFVLKTDGSGNLSWASQTVATPTWSSITGKPTFATVATSGDYNDLSNTPTGTATTTYVDNKVANVTWANLSGAPTLATVATSGSYGDLTNVPNLMGVALSGNYNDLSNRPSIPSIEGLASETYVDNKIANVTYANLSGTPTFATVATSGLYADLTYPTYVAENNLPDAANNAGMFAYVSQTGHGYVSNSTSWVKLGNFDDLPDLTDYALASSIPAAQIQSDWTQTDDGQKDFIKNKPALFSGSYTDLANLPSLFSGSYADLSNQPTIPTNLDSLSNVTITDAINGEVLKFNGTDWVNDTLTAGNPFDQNLNTSNSVEFANIYLTGNITSDTTLAIYTETGSGSNIDIRTDWAGNSTTGGIQVLLKHGTGLDIKTDDGAHVWSFDNTGNLTLPTNTSKINYANGTSILSGLSGLGGGASTGNMTFSGDNITGSDGVVRIRSLNTTTTASYNFTPGGGDYSTAVWDGQGITFNDPTQAIYDAIWALTNLSSIQVQVAGNWFTVTSAGSSTPGMPQAPTLFVNETAVSGPLNIDVVDIEIIQGTESYVEIDGSDFRVDVQDDIRIYGNDTFSLYNRSSTDPIRIETNDGDHTWEFDASGDLILPSGGDIIRGGTSVLVTNYDDLTNKPTIPTKTSDITNDSNFVTLLEMQNYVNSLINIDGGNASQSYTTTIDGGNA